MTRFRQNAMRRSSIAALATFGIVLAAVPAARARDVSCSTTTTGGTVEGNLVVPTGANCTLNSVTVWGNVLVGASAQLNVETGSEIGGNIRAEECLSVQLLGGSISVGGNIKIENCTGISGWDARPIGSTSSITIDGNFTCDNNAQPCVVTGGEVRGNVSVINNRGAGPDIFNTKIGGNLSVIGNSNNLAGNPGAAITGDTVGGNAEVSDNGAPSNTLVGGNTIGGNLQCQGNTPGVSDDNSGTNNVRGKKLGQCAGL
jgi:hypothetical protein